MKIKSFIKFINEGGHAVTDVVRINQENVQSTVNNIYALLKKLDINKDSTITLGSTGKKLAGESSGDIDIAILISDLQKIFNTEDVNEISDIIAYRLKILGYETKQNKGFNTISFAFEISNDDGKQEGQYVQTDFMLVKSLRYADFAWGAPHAKESKYKGVHYKLFLMNTLKVLSKKPIDENVFERFVLDLSKGLMKSTETILGKNGKILAKPQKISPNEFITDDPNEILKIIFKQDLDYKDINSFEKLWKVVQETCTPQQIELIKKETIQAYENNKVEVPDEWK